jgi:hypothetical protein
MPQTPHIEHHFASSEAVSDIVIGMADGLTVPFTLSAGLSQTLESSSLIVLAGLAEIVAGAIAMGLGGYLAARSDTEHYVSERAREEREVRDITKRGGGGADDGPLFHVINGSTFAESNPVSFVGPKVIESTCRPVAC